VNGCPQFTVNECKEHCQSKLDTVTIRVDISKRGNMRFLIDTGAEISVVKCTSLRPEISYESAKGISIKGISSSCLRTEGTARLKLFTPTHETTHIFHVMGNDFGYQYDGILGQDFWKTHRSTINYCNRTITMGEVIMSFDNEVNEAKNKSHKLTLKTRTERIVHIPTKSKGQRIISKRGIVPGVYLAESLTEEINGYCITSIVNTLEMDITIDSPHVELEEIEDDCNDAALMFTSSEVETKDRLSKLRDELRTDHLSNVERDSLVKICEEFNDIFRLPGDTLTFTAATEHTIPTPTIDPMRGINTKSYRIPYIHREEVQKQTEQMLLDGIIVPSSSPWNSPILVIPKKTDASGKRK